MRLLTIGFAGRGHGGKAVQTFFLLSAAPRLRANKINVRAFRDGGVWQNADVLTRRR